VGLSRLSKSGCYNDDGGNSHGDDQVLGLEKEERETKSSRQR
jgi:hypothetical protein